MTREELKSHIDDLCMMVDDDYEGRFGTDKEREQLVSLFNEISEILD